MAKLVNTNDFTNALFLEVKEFGDKVIEQQKIELNKASEKLLDEIEKTAPRSGSGKGIPLVESFTIFNENEFTNIIYSKSKSHIIHFVEFGTTNQAAQPFMRPAFEKIIPEMENNIKKLKGVD